MEDGWRAYRGPGQEKILAQVTRKSGKIANIWKLWTHSCAGSHKQSALKSE
jgi:hypothetical protein